MAAVDVVSGRHLVLIGALTAGPGLAALTGRWRPTAAAGLWSLALAVVCGVPDGIFATAQHLVLVAALAVAATVTTAAAAVGQNLSRYGRT